jgi:hypothetical protein
MRIMPQSALLLAVLALLYAHGVVVASGQDAQTQDPLAPDAPTPHKKRAPNPAADRTKATLPAFSLEVKADDTTAESEGS